jgi:hypothetical protein
MRQTIKKIYLIFIGLAVVLFGGHLSTITSFHWKISEENMFDIFAGIFWIPIMIFVIWKIMKSGMETNKKIYTLYFLRVGFLIVALRIFIQKFPNNLVSVVFGAIYLLVLIYYFPTEKRWEKDLDTIQDNQAI